MLDAKWTCSMQQSGQPADKHHTLPVAPRAALLLASTKSRNWVRRINKVLQVKTMHWVPILIQVCACVHGNGVHAAGPLSPFAVGGMSLEVLAIRGAFA